MYMLKRIEIKVVRRMLAMLVFDRKKKKEKKKPVSLKNV